MTCISTGRVEAVDGWIEAVARAQPAGPAYDGFASPAAAAMYLLGHAPLADRGRPAGPSPRP